MFERYNESAQQVLLLSRSIAGELNAVAIEPAHLLLAILQKAPELFRLWLHSEEELNHLREILTAQGQGPGCARTGEMILAAESKSILAFAVDEADSRSHSEIRPWHLLAGLLRSDSPAAEALREAGADCGEARLVFIASSSNGTVEGETEAADLFRLIEQLPASELGRARVFLQALVESHRARARD